MLGSDEAGGIFDAGIDPVDPDTNSSDSLDWPFVPRVAVVDAALIVLSEVSSMGMKTLEQDFIFPGFDYHALVDRLNSSQGRLETLDPVNQLFALSQMFYGMHITNHSALLRTARYVPGIDALFDRTTVPATFREFGMARREPYLAATQQIAALARQQRINPGCFAQAVEQVSVWLFAINVSAGFRGAPEPAETRDIAFAFQSAWTSYSESLFAELEYALTFSPTQRIALAVEYCLLKIDTLVKAHGAAIDRILKDPRYDQLLDAGGVQDDTAARILLRHR
ncbi:hypothetical protein JCM3766R1_004944 [Sporobolomyces carnicolor]